MNWDDKWKNISVSSLCKGQEIQKKIWEDAKYIEGYLIEEELSNALWNAKNNKSPGLDGFPAEFLKILWKSLKYCMTKAINVSLDKGSMPPSFRQCIKLSSKHWETAENIEKCRPL